MSKVAVWMTNYANEKHLANAIASVINQSFKDFTLYIFDNHSPGDAPRIIQHYAGIDKRIVVPAIPEGLAGIPLMTFAWNILNGYDHEYSITLGGHDAWGDDKFLETLVNRADEERKAGREFALIYVDTWQVNDDNQIVGRFQNIMQQGGQTPPPFVPQVVISTVDSPQLFGLWNEAVRKKVPVRHNCAGWDHLIVMHAALYGAILFEPSVRFVMRCPPPGDSLTAYGLRHFTPEARRGHDQDFIDQLEWITAAVNEATEALEPSAKTTYRACLTAAMFGTYVCLRGYNLDIFAGAMAKFQHRPQIQKAMHALSAATAAINELVAMNPK